MLESVHADLANSFCFGTLLIFFLIFFNPDLTEGRFKTPSQTHNGAHLRQDCDEEKYPTVLFSNLFFSRDQWQLWTMRWTLPPIHPCCFVCVFPFNHSCQMTHLGAIIHLQIPCLFHVWSESPVMFLSILTGSNLIYSKLNGIRPMSFALIP